MANFKTHAAVGTITGAVVGLVLGLRKQSDKEKADPLELLRDILIGSVAGFAGSCVPDIVEVADNPNHRSFFHSYLSGAGITTGVIKANDHMENDELQIATICFGTGYLSHLVLDCVTPKGLPLLSSGTV